MSVHADLIYDIGFHKGEDTAFYLKKGFRVVAFEAHPRLAEQGRELFADAVREGRFTMVEGAIVGAESGRPDAAAVNFYINESKDLWGTTQQSWVDRNARVGAASRVVTVAAVDFVGCLQTHGVPHFMKIDIEGSDWCCLEALRHVAERPDFVSIEPDEVLELQVTTADGVVGAGIHNRAARRHRHAQGRGMLKELVAKSAAAEHDDGPALKSGERRRLVH
jgi:FkbM family methyltransferase